MSRGMRLIALAGVVALALAACGDGSDQTPTGAASGAEPPARLQVVTTTTIIAALAEEVGGDLINVHSILQPGVDPHTFEPSPDQATDVAAANLVLMHGIELDEYLLDFVESANADAPVIIVTDGIELLGFEEGEDHEEDEHSEFDPHVWQDPLRVRLMVDNIAAALAEADSANADAYQANAAAYNARLDELDAEIRAMLDPLSEENRKVVTNHAALAYFAERYDIEIVGAVIPGAAADVEPSAQEIAELVEIIEHERVRAIFAEQLIDPKIAEQIANDTGVEIVYGIYTDSIGEPGSGAETVDGMLLQNATKFRDALSD